MIFTVGYEGRTVAQLVLRLREAGVERVVDVRARRVPRTSPRLPRGRRRFLAAGTGARTVLLCAEANPRSCHRSVLAEVLVARGEKVVHR